MKTQGEIEAAICEGMSRFEQEFMGRGPKDIRAHLIGDLLVVRLQGVLTAAEQHLVQSLPVEKGRDLLKQVRTQLIETARPVLETLGVELSRVPVITRNLVKHAKPDPDLFLAAADRLGVPIEAASVVGDSVWDMLAARRARSLGIGLLSGGYGTDELERAGAYRVYEDPADLLNHLDEVGGRR